MSMRAGSMRGSRRSGGGGGDVHFSGEPHSPGSPGQSRGLNKVGSFLRRHRVNVLNADQAFEKYAMPEGMALKDRFLQKHMARDALVQVGIDCKNADLDDIWMAIDVKHNNSVDLQEWRDYVYSAKKKSVNMEYDELRDSLGLFDPNNTGCIDVDLFRTLLRGKMSDGEVDEFCVIADTNRDGSVHLDTLAQLLCPILVQTAPPVKGPDSPKRSFRKPAKVVLPDLQGPFDSWWKADAQKQQDSTEGKKKVLLDDSTKALQDEFTRLYVELRQTEGGDPAWVLRESRDGVEREQLQAYRTLTAEENRAYQKIIMDLRALLRPKPKPQPVQRVPPKKKDGCCGC